MITNDNKIIIDYDVFVQEIILVLHDLFYRVLLSTLDTYFIANVSTYSVIVLGYKNRI
jgi:hypothetical protein